MENNSLSIPAVFIIAVIVCTVLISIIIIQAKKISTLSKPKYGFLGKPLALLITLGIAVFAVGITFYVNKPAQIDDINADLKVELNINSEKIEKSVYQLFAVAIIDGKEWQGYTFDIIWTVKNQDTNTYFEYNLSRENSGGITVTLQKGENIIKASTFFEGKLVEEEIVISL